MIEQSTHSLKHLLVDLIQKAAQVLAEDVFAGKNQEQLAVATNKYTSISVEVGFDDKKLVHVMCPICKQSKMIMRTIHISETVVVRAEHTCEEGWDID